MKKIKLGKLFLIGWKRCPNTVADSFNWKILAERSAIKWLQLWLFSRPYTTLPYNNRTTLHIDFFWTSCQNVHTGPYERTSLV